MFQSATKNTNWLHEPLSQLSPQICTGTIECFGRVCYDLTLTGLSKLDMSSLARIFVTNKFVGVGDVAKFYNQVFLSEKDFSQQLFVWVH